MKIISRALNHCRALLIKPVHGQLKQKRRHTQKIIKQQLRIVHDIDRRISQLNQTMETLLIQKAKLAHMAAHVHELRSAVTPHVFEGIRENLRQFVLAENTHFNQKINRLAERIAQLERRADGPRDKAINAIQSYFRQVDTWKSTFSQDEQRKFSSEERAINMAELYDAETKKQDRPRARTLHFFRAAFYCPETTHTEAKREIRHYHEANRARAANLSSPRAR